MDTPSSPNSTVEDVVDASVSKTALPADGVRSRLATAWAPVVAFLAVLTIYLLRLDQVVGEFKDDGWYLVLAKSLATGHGYNLINLPNSGHYFYPPFYPFLLSLLYRLWPSFPDNVYLLKSLSIVAVLITSILVYRLFNRPDRLSRSFAFLVALPTALAPTFVMLATSTLMSDCVFTALQFAALFYAERCTATPGCNTGKKSAWAAALFATAACLTRMTGMAVLAAISLHFLRRKMFKQFGILAASAVLFLGCWSLYRHYNISPNQVAPGYASQFWQQRAGAGGNVTLRDIPARVWQQSTIIVADDIGALFAPALYRTGGESGEELTNMAERIPWLTGNPHQVLLCTMGLNLEVQLISVVFSIFVLAGFISSVRRGLGILDLLFVFSLLLIVAWPWDPIRFLVPLFPMLLYYLLLGVTAVSRFLQKRFSVLERIDPWKASRVVALCILGLFIFDHVSYLIARRTDPASPRYPGWLAKFEAERQAAIWLREHTSPDEVVTGDNLPLLYLYSQRLTEKCSAHECVQKGIRYSAKTDSVQVVTEKVVFHSHNVRIVELQHATR